MGSFQPIAAALRETIAIKHKLGSKLRTVIGTPTAPDPNTSTQTQIESQSHATIYERITDGVVICDDHDRVVLVNQAARVLLNLTAGQAIPEHFSAIPLTPISELPIANGCGPGRNLFQIHGRVVRIAAAPFQSNSGTALGHVYVMEDLTDAIAIEQARTSFIATISHELRTPLMVLSGNADLLLRGCTGALTVEQQILIESIRTHTQRMAGLVNNVIILAELEAGMLPADPRPLRLSQSLDEILWSIRRLLTLRGIALQIDLPPDLPLIVADRQHLAIILQQLLDNAQRYTIQGHITIRAVEETDTIRIDLSDTGCGIAPETAATLFTRFNRNQERLNTTQRGFGLGLAIARELTEHQGGQIWLAETSACGTTFSLRLPCVVTLPTDTAPLSYAAAA